MHVQTVSVSHIPMFVMQASNHGWAHQSHSVVYDTAILPNPAIWHADYTHGCSGISSFSCRKALRVRINNDVMVMLCLLGGAAVT